MGWWVPALGYLAALVIIAGLALRRPRYSRPLWIAGGVLFVAYGVLSSAWPVALAGLGVAAFAAWRARGDLVAPSPSEINAVPIEPQHPFLQDFLRANLSDIRRSQPDFDPATDADFVRLVTRHGYPAGVLIGRPQGQELDIVLDYVTPRYRDSRSGRWLLGEGRSTFTDAGFRRLTAAPTTSEHRTYLDAMGFHPEGSRYVKEL